MACCIKENLNITLEDVSFIYEFSGFRGNNWFLLRVFGWEFIKHRLWFWWQSKSEDLPAINLFLSGTLLLIGVFRE